MRKWGEKYTQAARITGYDAASLRNMAWGSSEFDVSLRSDKLSWSHHVLLAPLADEEKCKWMERAEREGASVTELRKGIRGEAEAGKSQDSTPSEAEHKAGSRFTCPECGHQVALPED